MELFTGSVAMAFAGLLLGVTICLMGCKVIGFILVIFGFTIGFTWGGKPLADLLNTQALWVPWVVGAAGSIIAVVLWKISVYFAGTIIGLILMRGIFPELVKLAQVGIALTVGVLVQVFKKPLISFFTALAGAFMTGKVLAFLAVDLGVIRTVTLFDRSSEGLPKIIIIVVTIIMTVIGYLFQTRKLIV